MENGNGGSRRYGDNYTERIRCRDEQSRLMLEIQTQICAKDTLMEACKTIIA